MNLSALFWMVILLVANGFFVAAEFAFTAARRAVVEEVPGRSARAAARAMKHLSLTLAGAQIGITIATLLLGFVAEPSVASLLEVLLGWLPISDDLLHTIALVVALLIVVFLHMVIGEMAPKNIAIAAPERLALVLALPFQLFMTVFRPLVFVLNGIANLVLRLFGVEPRDELETTQTADDLAQVIAAGRQEGVIEEFAHKLLSGAIVFSERDASEVMVPRPDIVALAVTATPAEIERVVTEEGFSRIPVFGEDVDDIVGFVHAKDLLSIPDDAYNEPIPPEIIRPLLIVPESAPVRPLLADMQRNGRHLALIIDEHGGTAGLLTLEDIAEELVGEIRDEYDENESEVRQIGDARWYYVPGSARPDQLKTIVGIDLPEGEYETIGGFLMDRLGRVPRRGDRIQFGDWIIRVRRMDGRRIEEVELLGQ
ncbi:MAG TPA: hemolysin family protein [Acidimicrobiia bacterium]|nr:hemolysin family protein [Acidimicrobiia bacterium]